MLKKNNIFLIGPMGAGKSTIGRALAKKLQCQFYDSDQVIEQRAGADISWIFDIEGEDGFRKREQQVIDELTQLQGIVLATGGGAVATPENRVALAARGTVVYLKTSLKIQYQRTKRADKRPLLQTPNVKQTIDRLWLEREPYYNEIADLSFNTDELSLHAIIDEITQSLL